MTRLWGDGFDTYASGSDAAGRYSVYGQMRIITDVSQTAFNRGQCADTMNVAKTFETAANEAIIYFSLRLKFNSVVTDDTQRFIFTLRDGTSEQMCIVWYGDGSIQVFSGNPSGTLLGTFFGQFPLAVWNSWQGKVVINNATGSVQMRRDGSTTDAFTALTGVNTRGGSGNNYANTVHFTTKNIAGGIGGPFLLDDLWLNDDDGVDPAGFPPDVRCIPLSVAGSTATTDFLPDQATRTYGQTTELSTVALTSGVMRGILFTTAVGGEIPGFSIVVDAGFTGNIDGAVYDVATGARMNTPVTITNPTTGLNTFTFLSPVVLKRGDQYYLVTLSDTAYTAASTLGNGTLYSQSTPYAGGLLPIASFNLGGVKLPVCYADLTPYNWSLLEERPIDDDDTYVQSSVLDDEDLYTIEPLPVTPSVILGVEPIVRWKKTDSGYREGSIRLIANGSADTDVVTEALSNGYTYNSDFLPLDPTSAAWTQINLEACNLGIKVTA